MERKARGLQLLSDVGTPASDLFIEVGESCACVSQCYTTMCFQEDPEEGMAHLRSDEAACLTYQVVANRLRTSLTAGLPNSEAGRRHHFHGYNEFAITEDEPLWKKYLGQVSVSDYCALYRGGVTLVTGVCIGAV